MPRPRPLTKIIGGGIGLFSEYNAHRKANESVSHDEGVVEEYRQSGEFSNHSTDHDEETWELDDVHDKEFPEDKALFGEDGVPTEQILTAFFKRYPEPPSYPSTGRLPAPVILPQRRPQSNTRGFVRAYAPSLQTCSIDQKMWLDFLTGFHKAIKMTPAFHVTNLAVGTTAITLQAVSGPCLPVTAAALAIHISIEASRRAYVHYNTNKYLDSMNDRLFHPRGLHAVIMKYNPSSTSATEVIDMNSTITRAVSSRIDPAHRSALHMSSGTTRSDLQLPTAAPLIFPALDSLSAANHGKSGFLSDYFDRRARATFAAQHPDSKLNVLPQTGFASQYADPTSGVNHGGLRGLVTGGRVPDRMTRRRDKSAGYAGNTQTGQSGPKAGPRGGIGMLKKAIGQDVLYLMVVNLPSEEEVGQVNEILGEQACGEV
jgi:hypothetical protein